jgi:hypothetical protein
MAEIQGVLYRERILGKNWNPGITWPPKYLWPGGGSPAISEKGENGIGYFRG